MSIADRTTYLGPLAELLRKTWPANRTVNIVCHGHSVPAGYFRTPIVDTFGAYPHQLHRGLAERFPFSVINCIVTAIGGENSESGAHRLETEVFCHRPDLLILDYALNDTGLGLERSARAWRSMLAAATERRLPVLLVTPSHWVFANDASGHDREAARARHATLIRQLAGELKLGLADADAAFVDHLHHGGSLCELLSQGNHPNRLGHSLIARELLRWFPVE